MLAGIGGECLQQSTISAVTGFDALKRIQRHPQTGDLTSAAVALGLRALLVDEQTDGVLIIIEATQSRRQPRMFADTGCGGVAISTSDQGQGLQGAFPRFLRATPIEQSQRRWRGRIH